MDVLSREQRSKNMASIRSRDTAPELIVRSLLHRCGFRFRVNQRGLPGTPDVVLRKHSVVVFVHGCFWHRHQGCKFTTTPRTRAAFWKAKFEANQRRDAKNIRKLRKLGWRVLVVWECQTRDAKRIRRRLCLFLPK
jgi:DNA mismatch endonuclease (patch repair protein)